MTIYELNGAFNQGLSMIYAASYGNLQYAVKKLLKNDMITFEERVENGRNKKIYHIKESGTHAFFKWMKGEIDPKHVETQMLAKIYFLGMIESKAEKEDILDNIISAADEYYKTLHEIKQMTDSIDVPKEYAEIAKYQFVTLDYGIGTYNFSIEWLKKLKAQL